MHQKVEAARRSEQQSDLALLAPADVSPLMHQFIAFIDDPYTREKVEADQMGALSGKTAIKNKARRPLSPYQVARVLQLSEQGTLFLREIAADVGASV